ncbi:MAG: UvrD-helicase domain-containing protein [Anaerolineae bacterium]
MSDRGLYGYRLRPDQVPILAYAGGRMAVSAVPGSGKTLTLALLAAKLIIEGRIGDEAEVLVVTVQNSAVDNITQRIRRILLEQNVPPVGYRVCTLHKLGSDLLRQRSDLVGVEDGFLIVDEGESRRTMQNAAAAWVAANRALWESFLPEDDAHDRSRLAEKWVRETEQVGRDVTKTCKHLRRTPDEAARLIAACDAPGSEYLSMGVGLYALYQNYLRNRSGLDFDDLIWRAMNLLEGDITLLAKLRERWPYILEDEAQDSSPLQEMILDRLAGREGNWIRVGDPNQSINSTFTSADPRYFRRFARSSGVQRLTLPESGRCARPIIALANRLVEWTCAEHPEPAVRERAFEPQQIRATGQGDPQPNPADTECRVFFRTQTFRDSDQEGESVARWAADYVAREPAHTVAVLVPAARQGTSVVKEWDTRGNVPFDDLLRSAPRTRNVSKVLSDALKYLSDPTQAGNLASLYRRLAENGLLEEPVTEEQAKARAVLLRSMRMDDLLFPRDGVSLGDLLPGGIARPAADVAALSRTAGRVARWVRAIGLPIDQLVLTLAQDLYQDEGDLAVCHSVAASLAGTGSMHPDWRLAEFARELDDIAANKRALNGLSLAEEGYAPRPGRVVVTTMHKAKGLEWDAVYLMCVDSLEFPDTCDDAFRSEPYFMPGRAPAVEARMLLERLGGERDAKGGDADSLVREARLETICERLRLLYVGITRAKRCLSLTWSAKNGYQKVRPSAAALELQRFAGDLKEAMRG